MSRIPIMYKESCFEEVLEDECWRRLTAGERREPSSSTGHLGRLRLSSFHLFPSPDPAEAFRTAFL